MKCIISQNKLSAGLKKVITIISSRTPLPILNNVLIKTGNEEICITTTDLEIYIKCTIPAIIEEPGSITLPAKKFTEIISALPDDNIILTSDEEQATSIACKNSFFKVVGLSPQGFPMDSAFEESWTLNIPANDFRKSLSKVSYSRSSDDGRPILNGILLSLRSNILTYVATDGRRLALIEKNLNTEEEIADGDVILPPKVVAELEKMIGNDGDVNIKLSDNQVSFEFENTLIISKLVEGVYPNYRQVVPENFSNSIIIPREIFSRVLKRVSMVVSENSSSIGLSISGTTMEVFAHSPEYGEACEPMEVAYEGDPVKIFLNPIFLADPLKFLECDQLVIHFNDEFSPISISGDEGFMYIIMPMRD